MFSKAYNLLANDETELFASWSKKVDVIFPNHELLFIPFNQKTFFFPCI